MNQPNSVYGGNVFQMATKAEAQIRPETVDAIAEHLDVWAELSPQQRFVRRRETAARIVAAVLAFTKAQP